MKNLILLLPFLFLNVVFSQEIDISRLKFKTAFEDSVFRTHEKQEDLFLFLAIADSMNTKTAIEIHYTIQQFNNELNQKYFTSLKEHKQIKLLFNSTHKEFFNKYTPISNFDHIFSLQEYNCVSATALYGIILDVFNIPYHIMEKPTHVYSIAYPETKKIILESTMPVKGYSYPSNYELEKAINFLLTNKFITQEEINTHGAREVYNNYFYNDDNITMPDLAGLQYYNEAIFLYNENKIEEALNSLNKAQYLYPSSEQIKISRITLIGEILNGSMLHSFNEIKYLVDYSILEPEKHNDISSLFSVFMNNNLLLNSNLILVDSAFNYIKENIKSEELLNDISEIYYINFSQYYGQLLEYNKALNYAQEAYKINPQNVSTKSFILQSIIKKYSYKNPVKEDVDELDTFYSEYDFLQSNSMFIAFYTMVQASIAYDYFEKNNVNIGMEYLTKMKDLYLNNKENNNIEKESISLVYAEAGAAYYRKKEYNKALSILEKGLLLFPESDDIKRKIGYVNDALDYIN